jgi:hypothetical protein
MAWKIFPLRHFFPLKVVPLIEVLLELNLRVQGMNVSVWVQSDVFNCQRWMLNWSYRRQNLLAELVGYNADILCLQVPPPLPTHTNIHPLPNYPLLTMTHASP